MRIKICGIARPEDAELATELGAWALGVNLWSESPRFCEPDAAGEIAARFRRRSRLVAVFVNPSLAEVARAVEDLSPAMVQLHGDEGPVFCREVARRTGVKVIKALGVRSGADVQAAAAYRTDFHLLDAYSPARGGSGESFDWELAGRHRSQVPTILAGGLRPDNVAEAIEVAEPHAVDVASGVEDAPGVKSEAKLREFFARANEAGIALRRDEEPEAGGPASAAGEAPQHEVIVSGRTTERRGRHASHSPPAETAS